jgi:hypothetical protein
VIHIFSEENNFTKKTRERKTAKTQKIPLAQNFTEKEVVQCVDD